MTEESCPRTLALSALLDGELARDERNALRAHAAGCSLCGPMLAALRAQSASLRALPDPVPPVDLAGAIEAALPPPRKRGRAMPWRLLPLGFGAAAAVSAGAFLGSTLVAASEPAPAVAALAVFDSIPPGGLAPASTTLRARRR